MLSKLFLSQHNPATGKTNLKDLTQPGKQLPKRQVSTTKGEPAEHDPNWSRLNTGPPNLSTARQHDNGGTINPTGDRRCRAWATALLPFPISSKERPQGPSYMGLPWPIREGVSIVLPKTQPPSEVGGASSPRMKRRQGWRKGTTTINASGNSD